MTKVNEENNQSAASASSNAVATNSTDAVMQPKNVDNRPTKPRVIIRPMQPDDIPHCLKIFAEHDLPESAHSLYTFRALDPLGSWVAEHADTGEY